jgi:predicted permease
MTILVSIFTSDILPIFLIASMGFIFARRLNASVQTLAHVVFYVLTPCLVFNLLIRTNMTGLQFGRMVLLAILITGVMGLLSFLVTLPLRLPRSELSAFLLVVMLSNSGNYGLPVVLFAFGAEAMGYATAYFVTTSMLTYTVGVFLAAAGRRTGRDALVALAKVPALYSLVAAVLVLNIGVTVPVGIMRPITLLSDAALPLMILVLGMQLERASFPKRPALVLLAVCLSLLIAPLVALGLTSVLGIDGAARQAGVILASMPAAVVATILALEFDVAPSFVTNVVFVTTLFSPLTLTPLIAYLMK